MVKKTQKEGVRYSLLALGDRLIAVLTELEPDAETPFFAHNGEEIKYIIEGKIECISGSCKMILKDGDVVLHRVGERHKVKNIGKKTARYIAVASL